MTPRKLNVFVACFCYGGNGGISSVHPDIAMWLLANAPKMKGDRIGWSKVEFISDTPITMTRNKAITRARELGADIVVMLDSDMRPDLCLDRDPLAKPFWDTSFDYLYKHYDTGPVMIGAPYCGPPPHENVYVFRWRSRQGNHPDDVDMQLEQYTREEAAIMGGIQEAAALPTGVIMADVRLFELSDPKSQVANLKQQGYEENIARDLSRPWFYYEWQDEYGDRKASTEDVTATRDLSLIGQNVLGYNPILCNWDAWGGHWKPKLVGKPQLLTQSEVATRYSLAQKRPARETRCVPVDFTARPTTVKFNLAQSEQVAVCDNNVISSHDIGTTAVNYGTAG